MTRYLHHIRALSALALGGAATIFCSAASASVSPLPRSNYTVRSVCAAPTPGHAGCMSLQLVPITAEAAAHIHPLGVARAQPQKVPSPANGDFGLRPVDLHSAYELPTAATSAQTIAIVDAYNDLTAEADLKAYDQEFSLPACTTGNGCFKQLNQKGESVKLPFPETTAALETAENGSASQRELAEEAVGWGLEISLDIESAHATCQNCKILLVEANSTSYENFEQAERRAETLKAGEISNSWGGPEAGETPVLEHTSPFDDPGTVITASAGDDGYLSWDAEESFERGSASFPASSPHVVSVGGTRLSLQAGGLWGSETVWNGDGAGGGGCSIEFSAQPWQQNATGWSGVGCKAKRAVADVSADADPYTGLAVHYSSPACETEYEEAKVKHSVHWCTIGGTSLASPVIASVFALAGGAAGVDYPALTLYENAASGSPESLHDVMSGSNGECAEPFSEETGLSKCTASQEAATSCSSQHICLAGAGYDGPTGVGTPHGISAFKPIVEGGSEEPNTPEEEQREFEEGEEEEFSGGGTKERTEFSPPTSPVTPPPVITTGASSPGTIATTSSTARISTLALTTKALVALNSSHPKFSQVIFIFTITAASHVRVTLAKRVRAHHHTSWHTVKRAGPLAVASGASARSLSGHGRLTPGVYRLTLAPSQGTARSIVFRIG